MWSLRRHVLGNRFPAGRTVLHLELAGAPRLRRYWWIVVDREAGDVDICLNDPGHAVTLSFKAGLRTMVGVLMQDTTLAEAIRQGLILFDGDPQLVRRFDQL